MFGSTSKLSTAPTATLAFFKTNSTAGGNGGAISIAGGTHSLANAGFVGNDAQADTTAAAGIVTGMGGAIYSGGGTTTLTGCNFDQNTAGTNTALGVRGGAAAIAINNSHITNQNLTMGVNNKTKTGQAVFGVSLSPSGWVTDLHGHA